MAKTVGESGSRACIWGADWATDKMTAICKSMKIQYLTYKTKKEGES